MTQQIIGSMLEMNPEMYVGRGSGRVRRGGVHRDKHLELADMQQRFLRTWNVVHSSNS